MTSETKVAVIIPYCEAFTPRKMLNEAIQSVKKQSIQTEIIVVEDKDQKGPAWARNVGLNRAESRYVAFLDADDLWKQDKLERQINKMVKTGSGISTQGPPPMSKCQLLFEVFVGGGIPPTMPSVVIDTNQVEVRFEESLTRWEDILFVLECISESDNVCVCQNLTIIRRTHGSNLTKKNKSEIKQSLDSGEEYISYVEDRLPELRFFLPIFKLIMYGEILLSHLRNFQLQPAIDIIIKMSRITMKLSTLNSIIIYLYFILKRNYPIPSPSWCK
jgi:glycosyltransferase involved in cell wall biosynthesis